MTYQSDFLRRQKRNSERLRFLRVVRNILLGLVIGTLIGQVVFQQEQTFFSESNNSIVILAAILAILFVPLLLEFVNRLRA